MNKASGELKIFSGTAHPSLSKKICEFLNVELGKATIGRFADGEINVKIEENVRGCDCFIIQPTCPPVNENLMELLIIIDALKRASATRITAVMPYYGYARQDRKVEPRVPISAKLVANLLAASKVDRILTLDLHAGQIQGFFDIPVDNLYAIPVFLEYLSRQNFTDLVIVSPDPGGVERARALAKKLNCSLAIIDKRRPKANEVAVMHVIGDVEGKDALIFDDMIDTGNTLINVADALLNNGCKKVYAAATHLVLSGNAKDKIENSRITYVIGTDSIPLTETKRSDKFIILSVVKLFAEAIYRIHNNLSVSALFI
jgi:ribose-phosphate pyrophosphokinase